MRRSILGLLFFLLIGGLPFFHADAQGDESLSVYDVEKKYLTACSFSIDKENKKIITKGDKSSCFMLGLLYTKTKVPLRKGQKKIGKILIQQSCKKGDDYACNHLKGGIFVGKGSALIYWTAIIAMGLAVLLLANMMFQEEGEYQAQEKLAEGQKKEDISQHGAILKYSRPFFRRYVVPIVKSLKNKKKYKRKI